MLFRAVVFEMRGHVGCEGSRFMCHESRSNVVEMLYVVRYVDETFYSTTNQITQLCVFFTSL